jgi:DNA replication protein DnaC
MNNEDSVNDRSNDSQEHQKKMLYTKRKSTNLKKSGSAKSKLDEKNRKKLLDSNLPKAYENCSLDKVTSKQFKDVYKQFCDSTRFAEIAKNGSNYLLSSAIYGVGKTSAACLLLLEVLKENYSAYFIKASDFRSSLFEREPLAKNGRPLFFVLANVKFLIFDDLGKELNMRTEAGSFIPIEVENLLRDRLQRQKNTIITTNLSVDQISKRYQGSSMASVLKTYHTITWPSDAGDQRVTR